MAEPKQQPTTEGETEVLVYKMNFTFINSHAVQIHENSAVNTGSSQQYKDAVILVIATDAL